MDRALGMLTVCVAVAAAVGDPPPKPTFYLPLDGTPVAALCGGSSRPQNAVHADVILTLAESRRSSAKTFPPGKVGRCYDGGDCPLAYPCRGNFRADEGTCSFWVRPRFRGDDRSLYCTFFGAGKWGMLYKYSKHTSLSFGTAKPAGDLYYDCGVRDISAWRPGQWHHVAVTWSRRANQRRIYVDGRCEARAPFPYHAPVKQGLLYVGAGCDLYPGRVSHSALDEFALWDRALDDRGVGQVYRLGVQGKALWPAAATSQPAPGDADRLNEVAPQAPRPPPRAASCRWTAGGRSCRRPRRCAACPPAAGA